MPRISPVALITATGETRNYLDAVNAKIGKVPNFFATAAHAPKIASAFGAFNAALGQTRLTAAEREAIALSQAAFHGCPYCSAAHTAIAKGAGVDAAEATRNLSGQSDTAKTQAVIDFASAILNGRGTVSDGAVTAFRAAGYDDGHIIEVVAVITANTFTNFTNLLAMTEVDFPPVALPVAAE
ncbi:MAG: carboxymuconolactone decarboxylase family protein [Sulfitobacter sp.]